MIRNNTLTDNRAENELLSSDIKEIIAYRPRWVVRKGSTVFLLVFVLILGLTFIIKYPDTIYAPGRLTASTPPQSVIVKKSGRLSRLLVKEGDHVTVNQVLGYIENSTSFAEFTALQQWVHKTASEIQANNFDILTGSPLPELKNLGQLQKNYEELRMQLLLTKQTLSNGYYNRKINAAKKDIAYLGIVKKNAQEQQQLVMEDNRLQNKEYAAYEELAREKVIAPLELNQYKSKLLAKEQGLKQAAVTITNVDINNHGKTKEILELNKQMDDQRQNFSAALFNLKSTLQDWFDQNVITATVKGKINFVNPLIESQEIIAGQTLFLVQPEFLDYFFEITVSQKGFGKIKKGQQVILKLESFPSEEFGYVAGRVTYIPDIHTSNDSFRIKAALPAGLLTNFGKNIPFKQGLMARASIITDNRKLAERFTGELYKIITAQ